MCIRDRYWTGNRSYSSYADLAAVKKKGYGFPTDKIPVKSKMQGRTVYVTASQAKAFIQSDSAQYNAYIRAKQKKEAQLRTVVTTNIQLGGGVSFENDDAIIDTTLSLIHI